MKIAGFIKTTLLDWDGMVACTVYLAGCNMRCPYCHNKEIVINASGVEGIPEDDILNYVNENRDFIDAVVVSGGEPLMNADVGKFLKKLKALGVKVKVDTNGCFPDRLADLIGAGLIDRVAMDVKSSLNERYNNASGIDTPIGRIKESIRMIIDSGVEHEFRTTVVPVIVKEEDIENICRNIKGADSYRIQQFRNKVTLDDSLSVLDPYPESKLIGMAELAKQYVKDVKIRGI
jgi:pyruvate formate lyase activating enzyme